MLSTKRRSFITIVRTPLIFSLLIFSLLFLSLTLVAGETNDILPIDSLSSENLSRTSLVFSGEEILSLPTEFSAIYQEDVVIGEPVEMYQLVTITNTGEENISGIFSLLSYESNVPTPYVREALSITISSEGKVIAKDYFTNLQLAPGETKELYVDYVYVPVQQHLTCEMKSIADLLPIQAQVQNTTIDLGIELKEVCTLTLAHEGTIHYYDVDVSLDGFDVDNITSIYYVQGNQYIKLNGTEITIPKPEND